MAPRHKPRAAPAGTGNGSQIDLLGGAICPIDNLRHGVGQLIDKHGHRHSEHIFENWTPAAIRALGIQRVDGGGGQP